METIKAIVCPDCYISLLRLLSYSGFKDKLVFQCEDCMNVYIYNLKNDNLKEKK